MRKERKECTVKTEMHSYEKLISFRKIHLILIWKVLIAWGFQGSCGGKPPGDTPVEYHQALLG